VRQSGCQLLREVVLQLGSFVCQNMSDVIHSQKLVGPTRQVQRLYLYFDDGSICGLLVVFWHDVWLTVIFVEGDNFEVA